MANGKYFEVWIVGETYLTPRRTITQTDIISFAQLSGDFNPPHVDFEYCKTQPYGEIIAHGPLIYAVSGGLMCQAGFNNGTIVALLGVDDWRIHAPVKHGDTIQVAVTVVDKRLTSKGDKGIVTVRREIRNQHGVAVHTMNSSLMYLCREAAA
jgi:acyl dehydratase